jgi:hypothetical protein
MSYTLPTLTDDQIRDTGLIVVPGPLTPDTVDLVAGYSAGLYDRARDLRVSSPGVLVASDDTITDVQFIPRSDTDAIAAMREAHTGSQ